MAATIGGPGINDVDALDGEEVLYETVAEHVESPRSFEGKLFVTNYRILFLPFETERVLGAVSVDLLREAVIGITYTLPETGELLRTPRAELHIRTDDDRTCHLTVAFYREPFRVLQEALGVGG
jgi:hypothetical protein